MAASNPVPPRADVKTSVFERIGTALLALLFDRYTRVFRRGGHRHGAQGAGHRKRPIAAHLRARPLADLDAAATRLGSAYRGAGVLMGALAAVITFLALLPVLVPLGNETLLWIGAIELALMVFAIALVFITRRTRLHDRWITLRRAAEWVRYGPLRTAIEDYDAQPSQASLQAMIAAVQSLVSGGPDCQLTYHQKRLLDHEEIEAFGMTLTYVSFGAALIAAVLHLFLHAHWLLFFTVYLPALVGLMHAVNGFLRLPQLVAYHGEMVEFLESTRQQMLTNAPEQSLAAARKLLGRLEVGDRQWSVIAREQELHPL